MLVKTNRTPLCEYNSIEWNCHDIDMDEINNTNLLLIYT